MKKNLSSGSDNTIWEHESSSWLIHREGSGDSVEIIDINVANGFRRQGVGKTMLDILLKEVEGTKIKLVYAITRSTNKIAQNFYEGMNFRVVGVLREFYKDEGINGVDAIMYGRDVNDPTGD